MAEESPVTRPFHILTVCTMNICRSPALEVSFENATSSCEALPLGSVVVASAGTHAVPGATSCDISLAHVGRASREQRSRQLTGISLAEADLVIVAERKHAHAVTDVSSDFASRCFTAREAARLSSWVASEMTPAAELSALPARPADRLRWLVDQMDVARATAPQPTPTNLPYGVEDIPDPHVLGFNLHEMSAQMIIAAVDEMVAAAAKVLSTTPE